MSAPPAQQEAPMMAESGAGAAPQTGVDGRNDTNQPTTDLTKSSPPAQIVSDILSTLPAVATPANNLVSPPLASATKPACPPQRGGTTQGRWTKYSSSVHPPSTPAKIPIIDTAPGTGIPSPAPRTSSGFPSPGREKIYTSQKFLDDRTRITFGIQQSLPEAARRAVRDNWEKCLLGSDFHQAFILNASIHHATPAAIQRGVRDFGRAMVATAKNEIIELITVAELDQLADRILAKASSSFLDKALEKRLQSIEAKRLINALARAERLGYEPSDVQDENDHPPEATASSMNLILQSQQVQKSPAAIPSMNSPQIPSPTILRCDICFRRFSYHSAYDYHVKGSVCTRIPKSPGGFKYNCQHCGQGFTTVMGLQYHNTNKVCGDFPEPSPAKPSSTIPTLPTPVSTYVTPHPMPATPISRTSSPLAAASLGTPSQSGFNSNAADPYAHLSPEQMASMQDELRLAQVKYGERIRQTEEIADEIEKKTRLDALSNSFATKQSLIRKKYGVRLRARRSKAQVQADKERMQYKTSGELQAEMGLANNGGGPGRPLSLSYRSEVAGSALRNANNHPGTSGGRGGSWAAVNQKPTIPSTTLASSLPVPQPKIEDSGEVSMQSGGKRRFSGTIESSNHKRIAYDEMSGLAGAKATAETTDPTLSKVASKGTAEEPMQLDDSGTESGEDSDDEDIPAQLPESVRQSLQRSGSATASRSGSSPAK